MPERLGIQQLLDDRSLANGQGSTDGSDRLKSRIDTEAMEDRRVKVLDFDGLRDSGDRVLVISDRFVGGLAVDVTAAEGATEDCRAEADWPVVTTVSDIDLGGSSKFTATENHGGIQKVSGFEQPDQ